MKTRNGFVSNSSSSSFVVITTRQNLDNIKANASDDFKQFITTIEGSRHLGPRSIKVHGIDLIDLSRVVHDGYIHEWEEEHGNGDVLGYDLWSQLINEINKGGGYVSTESC